MICAPCAAGTHTPCRECGCQHRVREETRAPKQEVVQGSGNFFEPPTALFAPAEKSAPASDLLPPAPFKPLTVTDLASPERLNELKTAIERREAELENSAVHAQPEPKRPDIEARLDWYCTGCNAFLGHTASPMTLPEHRCGFPVGWGLQRTPASPTSPIEAEPVSLPGAMHWGETRSRCGASHLETGSRCVYVQGHQGDHRWEFEEDTAMADAVIERDEWPASDGVPFEPHLQEIHDGMAERGLFAVEPHTGDPEEDGALVDYFEHAEPMGATTDEAQAAKTFIVFCDEPYPTSPSFAPACEREDGHPGQHFNGKTWWGPHAAEILQREKDAADPPKS